MLIQFKQPKIEKKILVVLPNSNFILQKILGGFTSTLDQERRLLYHFEIISGKNDEKALEEKVSSMLNDNTSSFDLVFSVGTSSTRIVNGMNRKRRSQILQVFCGVDSQAIMVSNENPKDYKMVGVATTDRDYSLQIKHLLNLLAKRPQKILILSTTVIPQQETANIINEIHAHDIETIEAKINDLYSYPFKDLSNISRKDIDLVVIPRDTMLVSIMTDLAEFCNYKKLPLYTSDFESVKSGAAFGFGFPEETLGIMAANNALPIMIASSANDKTPITLLQNGDTKDFLMLNIEGINKQQLNLRLTPEEIKNIGLARVIPMTRY